MKRNTLLIKYFIIGPLENNSYMIADPETLKAAVIDPSFDSEVILEEAQRAGWNITQIWLTHAHFDHIAGATTIASMNQNSIPVYLHPDDLNLYRLGGRNASFGMSIGNLPEPQASLQHRQQLLIGNQKLEVRHTPGHTPGHVVFHSAETGVVFCGDLIFYQGIGRTDMPGGDFKTLINSIQTQILTLPPETDLLSGHGPATTVGDESENNPFI